MGQALRDSQRNRTQLMAVILWILLLVIAGPVLAVQKDRLAGFIDCNTTQPLYVWIQLTRENGTLRAQVDINSNKMHARNLSLLGTISTSGDFELQSLTAAEKRSKKFVLSLHGALEKDNVMLADVAGIKNCQKLIAAPVSNTTPAETPSGILQRITFSGRHMRGVDSSDCATYATWLSEGKLLRGTTKRATINSRFADSASMWQMLGRDIEHWQAEDARKFRAFTTFCKKQVKKSNNAQLTQLSSAIADLGGWGPKFLKANPGGRQWRDYRNAEVVLQAPHFEQLRVRLVNIERTSLQTAASDTADDNDPCQQASPDNLDQVYACMMTADSLYWKPIKSGGCVDFRKAYSNQLRRRGFTLTQIEARLPDCALIARAVEEKTAAYPVWQACFDHRPQPETSHVESCLNAVMKQYYGGLRAPRRNPGTACEDLQFVYRRGVAATMPDGIEGVRTMVDPPCELVLRVRKEWVAAATEVYEREKAERQRLAAERQEAKEARVQAQIREQEERIRLEKERAIQAEQQRVIWNQERERRRAEAERLEQARRENMEAEIQARYYTDTPESIRSKHSERERSLMDSHGIIQVPANYTEPSVEEIRLAEMREIMENDSSRMVNGHLLYKRRFNSLKDFAGFEGHEGAEVRFSDVTKLGCKKAATTGYLCRYRMSKSFSYDEFTREGTARVNNSMVTALFAMQEIINASVIQTEGKVLENWFVLKPDGWRSPLTHSQQVELDQRKRENAERLQEEARKHAEQQRQRDQEELFMMGR